MQRQSKRFLPVIAASVVQMGITAAPQAPKLPPVHSCIQQRKNRLTAYSRKHPAVCKLTDVDPDTGCKEFEIEKGRFSFRLTAPYREERRREASKAAKNE